MASALVKEIFQVHWEWDNTDIYTNKPILVLWKHPVILLEWMMEVFAGPLKLHSFWPLQWVSQQTLVSEADTSRLPKPELSCFQLLRWGAFSYTLPYLGQVFYFLDHWFVDAESSCSPWLSLYPRLTLILELWHVEFWLPGFVNVPHSLVSRTAQPKQ